MSREMRIAMLSVHSCPAGSPGARDTGGMSVYIRELAGEMGRKGHRIDIYTSSHDGEEASSRLGSNVRLIHISAGEGEAPHKLALYTRLPDFACSVEGHRRDESAGYDLVFSHYWLSGWVGRYLARWWAVPHAMMFHTLGAVKNSSLIGEDEPELRLQTEKELARDADLIIAATEKEKGELISYGALPGKIPVIPCGVNLGLFQPVGRLKARRELSVDGDKLVLFVGRIERLKGIDQLIRTMAHLQPRFGARLLVIGGDEQSQSEMERLRNLAAELKIQHLVSFLGAVDHARLPVYYSAADVCVLPSYYESFGLVALESLACGTPVVSTAVGGAASFIRQGETGFVVENNPRRIARRIGVILAQPTTDEKRASIRQSVAGFGWAEIARRVTGELSLLLERRRGHG